MSRITVNGKEILARDGVTILTAARENGIDIPTLCFMEGVSDIGMCRLCVVEVEGYSNFLPACRTKALEGMVITTESDELNSYRREMLELILASHYLDCMSCPANGSCELQDLCNRFDIRHSSYEGLSKEIKKRLPPLDDNPFITYDPS
ncbi:MAG: (2Fe-2S)-binding protein [Oscillospiraceae bacterium]|nr:(2Fe-2S)-binding protein [Oscillospiraceae bacterium]